MTNEHIQLVITCLEECKREVTLASVYAVASVVDEDVKLAQIRQVLIRQWEREQIKKFYLTVLFNIPELMAIYSNLALLDILALANRKGVVLLAIDTIALDSLSSENCMDLHTRQDATALFCVEGETHGKAAARLLTVHDDLFTEE